MIRVSSAAVMACWWVCLIKGECIAFYSAGKGCMIYLKVGCNFTYTCPVFGMVEKF